MRKNLLKKRFKTPENCLAQQEPGGKHWKKRKKKQKMRGRTTINNLFTFILLYRKKLYFVRKHIWKNLVYIFTFALQFFCVADYWKCSN